MDDISFAAQCLVQLSHGRAPPAAPLDLSQKEKSENATRAKVLVEHIPPLSLKCIEDDTIPDSKSSYMVARILTDLTQIKQDLPEVLPDPEDNVNARRRLREENKSDNKEKPKKEQQRW